MLDRYSIKSMSRTLSFLQNWLRSRGAFFILNLGVVALMLWLITPYFSNTSSRPMILGRYSLAYFASLLGLVAIISVLLSLAILGANKLNRNLFLTLLVLFLICEISARLFFPATNVQEKYMSSFYPKPYVEFGGEPNSNLPATDLAFGVKLGVELSAAYEVRNELGFRGPLPARAKGNEFRVIMLGGSTVFSGFPLSNSIAGQLEALFHQDGHGNVKVYNWGVPAYVSGQELILLARTVVDYQPDLVIVYHGSNDVYFPYTLDPRPGYPFKWLQSEAGLREIGNRTAGKQSLLPSLIKKSRFFSLLLGLVPNNKMVEFNEVADARALRERAGYGTEVWKQEIADSFSGNQRKMCTIVRGGRFKMAMFLQPMLVFKQPLVGEELRQWNPEDFQQYVRDCYQRMRRGGMEMNLAQNEAGCYFFDTSDIFLNYNEEVFADWVHINDDENRYVATHIYKHLREAGLINRPVLNQ